MTPEEKLAYLSRSLQSAGIDVLVMGGHAVRYYGIGRNTIDFDFVTALATPNELRFRLSSVKSLPELRPGPAWREQDFARFQIGRLPDGREEWVEFWIRNHLLDSFPNLRERAETGRYGGDQVTFLSLPDLLKSKETERESDWSDIALLEEVLDDRNFALLSAAPDFLPTLLARLRSRRGMDRVVECKLASDPGIVQRAAELCVHPVPLAFMSPLTAATPDSLSSVIELSLLRELRQAGFATKKHFALIEVCRRSYKRRAIELDRVDKQARLAELQKMRESSS